jgi:salicylate hydroxylase
MAVMKPRRLRIAVVGGGIGELKLALALRLRRLRADVIEQTAQLVVIGAAVAQLPTLPANGSTWGGLDRIAAASTVPTALIYRNWQDGRRIAAHPSRSSEQYRRRFGSPYLDVHRASLQRVLSDAVGGNGLHLGHRLEKLIERPGSIDLVFTNGHVAQADLVIGANVYYRAIQRMICAWGMFD